VNCFNALQNGQLLNNVYEKEMCMVKKGSRIMSGTLINFFQRIVGP
jgi:hypothetical protein